ncbi:MAG: YqaA family protein [Aquificota bacterium]|nr:YqaA family protein [Aquificota bacterium]
MLKTLEAWARDLVADYGYLGIFMISFTESLIQPVPPDPFIAGGSAFGLDPVLSALVATVASVLGGLTAHTLGMVLGDRFVKKLVGEKSFVRGETLFSRYGVWAVLVAAVTPIPFKAVCWLAGVFRMPRVQFLVASFIGRLPRFLVVAVAGDVLGRSLGF